MKTLMLTCLMIIIFGSFRANAQQAINYGSNNGKLPLTNRPVALPGDGGMRPFRHRLTVKIPVLH